MGQGTLSPLPSSLGFLLPSGAWYDQEVVKAAGVRGQAELRREPLGTLCAPLTAPFPYELGVLWSVPCLDTCSCQMLPEPRNQIL